MARQELTECRPACEATLIMLAALTETEELEVPEKEVGSDEARVDDAHAPGKDARGL